MTRVPLQAEPQDRTSALQSRELAYRRYEKLLRQNGISTAAQGAVNRIRAHQVSREKPSLSLRVLGNCLIAPFFLCSSLFVILLVPEKLVKKITAPFAQTDYWEKLGKRTFDFLTAIIGFLLSSIIFLIVPALIKLDSRGPVYYGQQRVGINNRRRERRQVSIAVRHDRRHGERRVENLHGRPFTVYKFRTMRQDAEKHSGAIWAQKNDPRVTRVGKILRFTHVDEIPQFLNVLYGEMSMVGPRPERPQIIPRLVQQVPDYPRRLEVKPGMTGMAQIHCGYDSTIEDVREKVRHDITYVNNHTLRSDIRILWDTLWMIIRGRELADG